MPYKFRHTEIESMKQSILIHCEAESRGGGDYNAWRLRAALEGQLYCTRPSKRVAGRIERNLALYSTLTRDDAPAWIGCDFWHVTDAPGQLPPLPAEIAI